MSNTLEAQQEMTKNALSAIALLALATANASYAQEVTWSAPAEPFRIIDTTYYVGTEGLPNFLVATAAGLVLLDVGLPSNAPLVEDNIRKLGFKLSDIKILLNSHAHFDHAGGLARLKDDTGALVVAHEGDVYALEKGVYPGSEDRKEFQFPPVRVDRVIHDLDTVTLGDLTFTAHLTAGHTKGCTTWTWPVKDKDGKAHTAIDFCSASVAANHLSPEQYPGMIADYKRTFATAPSIQGDVFLAPHAEFMDLWKKKRRLQQANINPFIDRAGYERLLASQQSDFASALAATKP